MVVGSLAGTVTHVLVSSSFTSTTSLGSGFMAVFMSDVFEIVFTSREIFFHRSNYTIIFKGK